ncbi:MAG: DUF1015 domain-containing protein [Bacilli bacterium]
MSIIKIPTILMPKKNVNMEKWAIIACDQFTSQPEYWEKLNSLVGDAPSTLRLVFPEVYLEKDNNPIIDSINLNMKKYLEEGVLESIGECMVLIDRKTPYQKRRLGLVLAVDLDAYSYKASDKAMIRATEQTVIERIPPRVRIRKNALIELPHILLLINDKKQTIIENLYNKKDQFEKIYDFDLNMDGGHVTGYKIVNCKEIIKSFEELISKQTIKENNWDSNNIMQFVVGDGNHSLATAKTHWDNLKKTLNEKEVVNHPARYALVEVMNIFDEGLVFEPIHRVVFNPDNDFYEGFKKVCKGDFECILYKTGVAEKILLPSNAAIAVKEVQEYIDDYIKNHPNTKVDYVHGLYDMKQVCDNNINSIGITLPPLNKVDLFNYVVNCGSLPRKTFSMGHANEKRYYIESKMIVK